MGKTQIEDLENIRVRWSVKQNMPKKDFYLYHYTSPAACFNILSSKSLWFSNAEFFLDKSEIKYAFSVLKESIINGNYNEVFAKELSEFCEKQEMNEVLKKYFFITDGNPEYYIASFSTEADDLFMWNSYTKTDNKAGYCIEFFGDCFAADGYNASINLRYIGLVEYEKETQIQKMSELVSEYNTWYENNKTDKDAICRVLMEFGETFFGVAAFMKDPCFSAEKEFRIVIQSSGLENLENKLLVENEDMILEEYPIKVRYREFNGVFVPYFSLPIETKYISCIYPSPYMNYENAVKGLEHYKKVNHLKYFVDKSNIPFHIK